jgi:hypothetical protein
MVHAPGHAMLPDTPSGGKDKSASGLGHHLKNAAAPFHEVFDVNTQHR